MSEESMEAAQTPETAVEEAEPVTEACGNTVPQGIGYYPTPEQQDAQLRQTALHVAAQLRAPGHNPSGDVLAEAKAYYGFLSAAAV